MKTKMLLSVFLILVLGLTAVYAFAGESDELEIANEPVDLIGTPIDLIISDTIELKDNFELENISVSGDYLLLSVSYSGGCQNHEFNVLWNGKVIKTSPPQVDLYLYHDSNDDLCEAKIYTTFALKLSNFNQDELVINFFDYNNVKYTVEYNNNGVSFVNSSREKPGFCTDDAKICPDGSVVGRVGANCEFQSCAFVEENNNSCSKDLKVCSDGTIVSRIFPSCEFFECPSGNECELIGLRMNGNYCSVNKTLMLQQSEDSVCENNFECNSNVCISDKCVSSNLLEKIFSWFKKFFG
jgi:hypothetical protein